MKKLFVLMLAVMMMVCATAMTGCSKSVYDGNYEQADQTQVDTFATSVDAAENGDDFDYTKGISMKYVIKADAGDEKMDIDMSLDMLMEDEAIKAAGKMKMSGAGENMSADLWYKDNYMYMSYTAESVQMKMKKLVTIDQFIDSMAGAEIPTSNSITELLAAFGEFENVKFYIDNGETSKKFKLEIPEEISIGSSDTSAPTIKGAVYMVYDAEYNLTAVKFDLKMGMPMYEQNMTIEMVAEMQIKECTINFPTDLNTYMDMEMPM